ncbi:ABC transporter substrate-binding protein [Mycolicibacterium hodleri]|uniref:ABC transporter substrate-binding protein n=1 Tax=Mycolicibacterium hodleri TaxID=49897 RepID=UPI0013764305|nr:ABC transporter substrate-binding protein [Mycolicibacterium hodleri]
MSIVVMGVHAAASISPLMVPGASADPEGVSVALFFDSTETAYRVADHLYATEPTSYPQPPTRVFVTNADDAHERLLSGANPIVGMSLDDVISLVDGDDPRAEDLVVIAGVHTGFLQLVTDPEIVETSMLRSHKVAVDTDTGYASALFAILKSAGLQRDADYSVVYAGATNARYEKLLNGDFQATLLGAPFTDLALMKGYRSQGSIREQLGAYQGVVLTAKRSWLAGHAEEADTAVTSLLRAEHWAMDPANRDEVLDVVAHAVPGLADREDVKAVSDTLFGPTSEYQPDGHLSPEGIAVVVDLYNTSRGRARTAASVTDLIDYSYLPHAGR